MAIFWRWFLVVFALLSGATPLLGASARERQAYAIACAAFQDKFYDRAESGFTQFLQDYRKSTNAPHAVLLLAQAQYYLGKFPEAIARLTDTNNLAQAQVAGLMDRYLYWTAEARFASGDFQRAADAFVSLPEKYPQSPLGVNAAVEAAVALGKLGHWQQVDALLENTAGVFQRTAQRDPASPIVGQGRLLQAESKIEQQDFRAAAAILSRLNPAALTPERDWQRAYLLCRALLGRDDREAALAAAANARQIARQGRGGGWPSELAESVALYAGLLEQLGRLAEAESAWQENITTNVPVAQQQQAILKSAALAVALNDLTNAETELENYLTRFPAAAPAELARLSLGELLLKDFIAQPLATNLFTAALTNLDAATNSVFAGKAYLDLGWCNWLAEEKAGELGDTNAAAQKLAESLDDFQAAAHSPHPLGPEDLAVARFKMGDAQFALKDFTGAQTNYLAVLEDFPGLTNVAQALGERALYQIVRARLELHDTNLDAPLRQLLEDFFANPTGDSGLLLAGQSFSSFGQPARAREVFEKFEQKCTNSPLLPEAAFAVGRTFEREQNWPAAVTNYEAWLRAWPTNELRPQVEYAHAWVVWQTGDEARAFEQFTNFAAQYPTNTALTPLAQWWVADHYFRQGTNFAEAEKHYQLIFQNFPTNRLAYEARLRAGRAALARSGYTDASRYFLGVLTDGPDALKDQARFGYAEVLRTMAASETNTLSLQLATNYLSQMYGEAPTNMAGALAWCETGDCDWLMGAYDAATNAYTQVLNAPSAERQLRSRARVGLGNALKKKAEGLPPDSQRPLLSLALQSYAEVLYPTNEVSDPFWIKEAALQALPLIHLLKEGDLDDFVARMEHWLPTLKATLEKKRAALPQP